MEEDSKSPMVLIVHPDNPQKQQEHVLSIICCIDKVLSSPMCAVTWINAAKMDTCLSKIFKKVVMNSS
jgi:hypothetical protein